MCKVKTPSYTPPPSYARAAEPDNAAMYDEAMTRAATRGGGVQRSTILSGLRGTTKPPTLGAQTGVRNATVLG